MSEKRWLERELSPQAYERYRRCTAGLGTLGRAYREAWDWGQELASRQGLHTPPDLIRDLTERLDQEPR